MDTVFWGKMENRRQFFEKYAKQNRFDPLIAANWYLQFKGNILSAKVFFLFLVLFLFFCLVLFSFFLFVTSELS